MARENTENRRENESNAPEAVLQTAVSNIENRESSLSKWKDGAVGFITFVTVGLSYLAIKIAWELGKEAVDAGKELLEKGVSAMGLKVPKGGGPKSSSAKPKESKPK